MEVASICSSVFISQRQFFFNRLHCSNQLLFGWDPVNGTHLWSNKIGVCFLPPKIPSFRPYPIRDMIVLNQQKSHHLHLPISTELGTINSPLAAVHKPHVRSRNATATAPSKNWPWEAQMKARFYRTQWTQRLRHRNWCVYSFLLCIGTMYGIFT